MGCWRKCDGHSCPRMPSPNGLRYRFLNGVICVWASHLHLKQQPTEAQRMERRTGPDDRRESAWHQRPGRGFAGEALLTKGMVYGRRSGDRAAGQRSQHHRGANDGICLCQLLHRQRRPPLCPWTSGPRATQRSTPLFDIRELDRLSAMGGGDGARLPGIAASSNRNPVGAPATRSTPMSMGGDGCPAPEFASHPAAVRQRKPTARSDRADTL